MTRLLKYAKKYYLELILSCIAAFLFAFGFVMVIFYSFKLLLRTSSIGSNEIIKIIFWVLATGIGNSIEHYLGHDVAFKVLRDFRIMVYRKMTELGPEILDKSNSSDLLNLIGKDIDNIEVFYAHTLVPIVRTITFMIALFALYSSFSFYSGILVTCISLTILYFSVKLYSEKINKFSGQFHHRNSLLSKRYLEAIDGKDQIIQLGIENKIFNDLKNENNSLDEIKIVRQNFQDIRNKVLSILYFVGFISLVYLFYKTVGIDRNSLPYILIFPFIFEPYKSIARLPIALSNGIVAAKNLFAFLDTKSLFEEDKGYIHDGRIEKIEARDLSFSYPEMDENIFENIDFSFESGDRIGVFGESGSGKTTIAKVIMKWYPYNKGNLQINDAELNEISRNWIREKISYLPQNPDFFKATIRDNLTMLNEKISDEEILSLINKLNLSKKINTLEKGLDTVLNPENMEFSSGEQQRLDLIRALLNKSDVLILDEPLSNLDSLNEKYLLEYLQENYKGIVIIISHRYEAFSICDKIYELKDKKLILN